MGIDYAVTGCISKEVASKLENSKFEIIDVQVYRDYDEWVTSMSNMANKEGNIPY